MAKVVARCSLSLNCAQPVYRREMPICGGQSGVLPLYIPPVDGSTSSKPLATRPAPQPYSLGPSGMSSSGPPWALLTSGSPGPRNCRWL